MQLASQHAPWKVTDGTENLVLQAVLYQKLGVCHELPGGAFISHY